MTDKNMEEIVNEPLTLTLTLEDGKELNCEVLATTDYNDKEYIAVLPENEDEFWIYEYSENEDGTLSIDNIEDDSLFEEVGKIFEEMFDAEEDVDMMLDNDEESCDCEDDDCHCHDHEDDKNCNCQDDDCDCGHHHK